MTADPKAEARRAAVAAADQQMANAKAAFSRAAVACIKGALDAEQRVRDALRAVDGARDALRQATEET